MTRPDGAALVAAMPLAVALGIEVDEATPERVRARMAWREDRCTIAGLLHGGALMAFADSVNAVCAFLNLPDGANTATVESTTHFLRAVREGSVHATSQPLHIGRSTIVASAELADDQGRGVAHIIQTQAVLPA